MFKWTTISDEKPIAGVPLIVTIRNHFKGGRLEVRYPVYFQKEMFADKWEWRVIDIEGYHPLLPEYSEVIAWAEMPKPYEGE